VQYFIKVDDADVEKYLKLFTLLSGSQISEIISTHMVGAERCQLAHMFLKSINSDSPKSELHNDD